MMLKRMACLVLSIITILSLAGCGGSDNTQSVENAVTSETGVGEYILTTKDGQISMFDTSGNIISNISLNGTAESEFIYTMDEGNMYIPSLQDMKSIPRMMYAVDKTTRKLTMLSVSSNAISKKAEMMLSDGNITGMYGYNGLFYYSVSTQGIKATPYAFERRQKLEKDGTLAYAQTVPLENTEKSTFVYMENYFSEYLEAIGLKDYVSEGDMVTLNIPSAKHAIYEIPTDVLAWTANNTNIYFFSNTQMGIYNTTNNKITVYYGAINPIKASYIDGINKRNYLLSDFGDGSDVTTLMEIDYSDMKVDRVIQISYSNPMDITVNKDEYIMMLFKTAGSEKTFSQLRVLNYEDCSELYSIGLNYLPTKVLYKDEMAFLFNPYENYFLKGSIHSGTFTSMPKKTAHGDVYSDIFIVDTKYRNDYLYDEYGRYIDRNGHLIDSDGLLIDENSDRVNILGQRIDGLGRAINKAGELIDRYNNLIDEDGNIIQYVQNADGYYYNGNGEKVDIDGTVLVRNDDGVWVRPEDTDDAEIIITGHYDEYGNFIIDNSILEDYPDAYKMWQEQQAEENSK